MVTIVDRFYELLGPRNWIFHGSLNLDAMDDLIRLDAESAEQALIRQYSHPETLKFQIQMLNRFESLRARKSLIQKAEQDFAAGRFYSTVLVLIAVMDGFVNDFQTSPRRGLHAREASEMHAWDSVVGHHMGLSHSHGTFTKSFRRTSSEEVYELYRNGIVHGMLTNFDNAVVAAKAWNRLFAVADWAEATEKRDIEPVPEPTWRETGRKIMANERRKRELDAWKPQLVRPETQGFEEEDVYKLTQSFLEGWAQNNFGAMAALLAPISQADSPSKSAGQMRAFYEDVPLQGFEITALDFNAAAVCEVVVELTTAGAPQNGRLRWLRESHDGQPALPSEDGTWGIVNWGPHSILASSDE